MTADYMVIRASTRPPPPPEPIGSMQLFRPVAMLKANVQLLNFVFNTCKILSMFMSLRSEMRVCHQISHFA